MSNTLNPQFFRQPAAHCRIVPAAGFAFATGCTGRLNVTNVVRFGAGDYIITTSTAFPLTRGWSAQVLMTGITGGAVPVAGYSACLSQTGGNTFRLTLATGGALADIPSMFDVTIDALIGDV